MVRSLDADAAAPGQQAIAAAPPRGSDYAQLSRLVKGAGLLERRPWYYVAKIAVTLALLAAGWAAFVLVGESWWQLAVAAFLAIMFTQMGFLGHDAGHWQLFRSRRANYVAGLLHGNLGIGLSYGWWVSKHNRHHAHPNTEGADPDVSLGALAFAAPQAQTRRGISRLLLRFQAYLFFPMLLLEAFSLHVSSIQDLTSRRSRRRPWEIALLAAHLIAYLGVVFLVLSPVKAVVFILVQQGLFGLYLGASFAPNHKGMAMLSPADRIGFLDRQVLTSRNVRGGWLTDLALGGLNYQIEHHLFPSMPRPNLRHSQDLIRGFCQQRGLPYCETSLARSYSLALKHLNSIALLAAGSACPPGVQETPPAAPAVGRVQT